MFKKFLKQPLVPSRRTFLRGVLAGSAVSIGLPPLELFLNGNGTAYANGSTFPKRFGIFFWGNGIHIDRWTPSAAGMGDDWSLSEQLMPLANVKENINVVTGMEVKVTNDLAHGSGPGGFLSGNEIIVYSSESYTFRTASLDQIIANEIGGTTPFRSIEVGVQPEPSAIRNNEQGYSFLSADTVNNPEVDPALIFERLFGSGFREPGEEGIIDPSLGLRRSVLDAVMSDANRLNSRLGAADKIRLEQHLDGIRSLEQRIALMQSDPPDYEACSRPDEPPLIPDVDGRPNMSERSRVITDLVAMALACDLTRVLTYWYSDEHSNILYPGASEGHHLLTHNEPGDQPTVNGIVKYIMGDLAYFIEKMRSVEEGDGNLLDNSVFLCTSGVSDGRTHRIDEIPIILAGSAGGRIKNNMHYRSISKANASHVPYTLMTAMDMLPASFGGGDGMVTEGLSEIEEG